MITFRNTASKIVMVVIVTIVLGGMVALWNQIDGYQAPQKYQEVPVSMVMVDRHGNVNLGFYLEDDLISTCRWPGDDPRPEIGSFMDVYGAWHDAFTEFTCIEAVPVVPEIVPVILESEAPQDTEPEQDDV